MTPFDEDPSMLMLRFNGTELASRTIALALAEMIFKNVYGVDDFQTQVPLQITDGGDRWFVKGSRRGEDYPSPPSEVIRAEAYIEILKANCQVVKLTQKGHLP